METYQNQLNKKPKLCLSAFMYEYTFIIFKTSWRKRNDRRVTEALLTAYLAISARMHMIISLKIIILRILLFGILQIFSSFPLLLIPFFCRCILSADSQPDSEILCPVSLTLLVQRNLAATWYHKAPTIGIKGDLKPMQVTSWHVRAMLKVILTFGVVFILVTGLCNLVEICNVKTCSWLSCL